MFLHEDREVFREIITAASEHLGMTLDIVEKDYYVTMLLKLLSERCENVVFKGGTSLSKALHVITRFSEDIDITFSEHIGAARRKKLKNVVIADISRTLKMPISNWHKLQSDRDVNAYIFEYESTCESKGSLVSSVKLETALGSYAFPTTLKEIDSYIFRYLRNISGENLIVKYGLSPFSMHVQSVERTFIDKIFALCDYYIQGKSVRLSRHMYDIYKIYPLLSFDDTFNELFLEVRSHRAGMEVCSSALPDVEIRKIIHEICESDFYKRDYEAVTSYFVLDPVDYEEVKRCFLKTAEKLPV